MRGDEDDAPEYVADSRRCRACEVRDIKARDMAAEAHANGAHLNGFYFHVQEVNGHG